MRKLYMFWAGLCVVGGIATACGQADTTTEERETAIASPTGSPTKAAPATGAQADGEPTITIVPMVFPPPITVAPGAQVKIVNDDRLEHSVVSETPGLFDVMSVSGGEEATLTAPTQPGEYPYHCMYHPYMRGTLIVQ